MYRAAGPVCSAKISQSWSQCSGLRVSRWPAAGSGRPSRTPAARHSLRPPGLPLAGISAGPAGPRPRFNGHGSSLGSRPGSGHGGGLAAALSASAQGHSADHRNVTGSQLRLAGGPGGPVSVTRQPPCSRPGESLARALLAARRRSDSWHATRAVSLESQQCTLPET